MMRRYFNTSLSSLKIVDNARTAVKMIESGNNVWVQGHSAAPTRLINGLVERASELKGVQLYHLLTQGDAPYAKEEYQKSFFTNCVFVGPNLRPAVNAGRAAYVPIFLSQVEKMFQSGQVPLDVALIHVSSPDRHGYCSLGTSIEATETAVSCARHVVAQINPNMPRTHGDGIIHVSSIDVAIEVNDPLPELLAEPLSPVVQKIGENVAELIPNGACIQMGIGGLPNAVLVALSSHRDLGVHTEMFSDGMLDLIEKGVINNRKKQYFQNQIVASFCMGTRRLFDFIHDNPMIVMQRLSDANDPAKIARNNNVVAINSAVEIDLTGQVCADSIGDRMFSGVGGQVDFVTGASMSLGGRAIIALPSLDAKTGRSRIVTTLSPGAGVVTTRAHMHYVATEFGVVNLFGKNLWERADALISIAHPTKRDELYNSLLKRAPQWRHLIRKAFSEP